MRHLALLVLLCAACGDALDVRPTGDDDVPDAGSPSNPGLSDAGTPDTRQGAPYPIVLVHGFGVGAHVGLLDYWWRIPDVLRDAGERVFVMDNDPLQPPAVRVEKLAAFVDDVLVKTNARKVNLVGHSMGGVDSRLLVSGKGYGDRVASITSIATPHRGSPVADAILRLLPDVSEPTIAALVNTVGALVAGDEQDVLTAGASLTTTAMEEFNKTHPDDARVTYFSIVGLTTADPLFLLHEVDYCDASLWATFAFLDARGYANDGLVTEESQRWGEVLATVPADHLNEVAQPLGVVAVAFDWKATYRELARTLHARGF